MNENERKVVVRRMLLLIAVACIIMGLYTFRLIFHGHRRARQYRGQHRQAHRHHQHRL